MLLLAITVIIGKIVIVKEHQEPQEEKEIEEVSDLLVLSNTYVFASSSPVHIKPQVLSTKTTRGTYMELISTYPWNSNVAYAVMMAESSGMADKINPHDYHKRANCWNSYGLFQMGCLHFGNYGLTESNWSSPEANVRAAYLLWKESGWGPWGAYTNGSYKKFLK